MPLANYIIDTPTASAIVHKDAAKTLRILDGLTA